MSDIITETELRAFFKGVLDNQGALVEAVRALKPAESGHNMPAAAELRGLLVNTQAEVERLQAELANRALTIGTLRDIIGKQTAHAEKLRDENAELKAACVDWQCGESNLKDDVAELKCFREREHKVDALLFGADGCATVLEKNREARSAQQLRADIAAVRDFKVTAQNPTQRTETDHD